MSMDWRRDVRRNALIVVAVVGVWSGSALAELRPAPLGDIYESYNDCFKVATKDGLSQDTLRSLGWSRATVSTDSKPEKDGPIIFFNPDRVPLILLSDEKGRGLCIVAARLENLGSFEEFKRPFGGKLPKPDAEGVITFAAKGHIVQLRNTGTAQAPGLSIAVMTPMESK
jgi:hypothetical protein